MQELETGLLLIAENPERGFFAGPRNVELIDKAELALGGNLPPSYRAFVEKLGAGNLGAFEVYGVIEEPFNGPIPDAVWITLSERAAGTIPRDMIIVGDSGDGGWYCIRQGDEGPVFLVSHGRREEIAQNFGAYFLKGISQ